METKVCPKCKTEKELTFEFFYKSNQTKSGFKCYCKECTNADNKKYDKQNPKQLIKRVLKSRNRSEESKQAHVNAVIKSRNSDKGHKTYRNNKLLREYGLTIEDYEQILESQHNSCAICNKTYEEEGKYLAVDHCHEKGHVRGILCQNCNQGLGQFKDSIDNLKNAITYLEESK